MNGLRGIETTYVCFDSLEIDSEVVRVRHRDIHSEIQIERIRCHLELQRGTRLSQR